MPRRLDLGLVVGAVGISALGDFLALVPLALQLQETTGSGILVALLFVAIWSPAIVLAGPAGLLADRRDPRRVLLVVSLVQTAVALALAFVDGTGAILVLATLLGCGFAIGQPSEFALVPLVAGEARIAVANARVETARYAGFAIGPLAGAALVAAGGLRAAMIVNAASFVVVAVVAVAVRTRPPGIRSHADRARERARDGILFLLREPTLTVVMIVAFVSLLFMTASVSAEVFFAKEVLDVGDIGYGILAASWMLGMVLGARFLSPRVAVSSLAVFAVVAIAVQGAGVGAPALWLMPVFAYTSYFVGGVAHGAKNVVIRTLMHHRVPESLHGRTFAAYNALRNAAELVAMLGGGVLVVAVGARWTLLLAGALPLAAALVALIAARRRLVRRLTT